MEAQQLNNREILQHVWSLSKGDWVFMPYARPGTSRYGETPRPTWSEGQAYKKSNVTFTVDSSKVGYLLHPPVFRGTATQEGNDG